MVAEVQVVVVSTHSRPKAAGSRHLREPADTNVSTHSRPKAAGCQIRDGHKRFASFNTQPPEGGWPPPPADEPLGLVVSTHSRPKAAGYFTSAMMIFKTVFQHTAARRRLVNAAVDLPFFKSFNTQPPEGGWLKPVFNQAHQCQFQHTAARRRLACNLASRLM